MILMSEQIRRMQHRFPDFRVTNNHGSVVTWEGVVRPLSQRYKLRVLFVLADVMGSMKVTVPFPRVWLVDPELQLGTDYAPDTLVPHIYPNLEDPIKSHLCLFDPVQKEWTRDMAIADTTLPWAIDWLVSYEGWLATGEWTGGGRDHGPPVTK